MQCCISQQRFLSLCLAQRFHSCIILVCLWFVLIIYLLICSFINSMCNLSTCFQYNSDIFSDPEDMKKLAMRNAEAALKSHQKTVCTFLRFILYIFFVGFNFDF